MDAATFAEHARVEDTHWWFVARRQILLDVVRHIEGPASARVLDVGCGTGGNAAGFAAAGYDVVGIDPSADAIGHARRRFPGVSFVQSDDARDARDHLALGGTAILADVLEHVTSDHDLLARTIAVLPAAAHVVITVPADPALWSPHDITFGHFRRYTRDTLAALWDDEAVDVRLLSHFNTRLRPMIALVRRLRRGAAATSGGDLDIPAGPLNAALRATFAGESSRIVGAIDSGLPAYRDGVSLIAVLRRR